MSKTIDSRVVELEFDNKRFEQNVATSMSTLDKLKEKLHFKGATKGLEELDGAVENVNMGGLGSAVESVTEKFSALKVMAVGALLDIGKKAEDAGVKLVKSLSVDQIADGWAKYGKKTESVQTIMNSTGESMKTVSEELEKINWFTDETSYNFTDMVDNVGKFTNNGIALQDAVTAMQGIAAWAGISGANSQQASRAMYNLSQAMGMGKLSLMDWTSLENAQMTTMEFRQTLLDVAESMGRVRYVGDGLYESLMGNTDLFTIEQIRNSLTEGAWVDKEVLTETLKIYGSFSTAMQEETERIGLSASEVKDLLKDYGEGTLDLAQAARETNIPAEELAATLERLSADEYDLGRRAFYASQISKTLADALNYTKDAVSTGWMNTFEYIFGNYEQATKLWSKLSDDYLYPLFVEPGEKRNELLKAWSENGGRTSFINGLTNALDGLLEVVQTIRKAFGEVFEPISSEKLIELTKRFETFTEKFKMTDETAQKVKNTFKGIFSVFKIGWEILKSGYTIIKPIFRIVSDTLKGVFGITGTVGETINDLASIIVDNGTFMNRAEKIAGFIEGIPSKLNDLFKAFTGKDFKVAADSFRGWLKNTWKGIKEFFEALRGTNTKPVDNLAKKADELVLTAETTRGKLTAVWEWLVGFAKQIRGFYEEAKSRVTGSKLYELVTGWLKGIVEGTDDLDVNKLTDKSEKVGGFLDGAKNLFKNIKDVLLEFGGDVFEGVKGFFKGLFEYAKSFEIEDLMIFVLKLQRLANTILKVVNGIIGASLLWEIRGAVKNVKTLIGNVGSVFSSINDAIKKFTLQRIEGSIEKSLGQTSGLQGFANFIIKLAVSVVAIAGAFKLLADIEPKDLVKGGIVIGAVVGAMALIAGLFGWQKKTGKTAEGIKLHRNLFNGTNFESVAKGFLEMSAGLLVISFALKKLAKIEDPSKLTAAVNAILSVMVSMMGMIAIVTIFVGHFHKDVAKQLVAAAGAFDMMAAAIFGIALSIGVLSIFNSERIIESAKAISRIVIAIGLVVAGITAIVGAFKGQKLALQMIGIAFAFDLMAAALLMISLSLLPFLKLDFTGMTAMEDAAWALAGLFALLGAFSAIFAVIGRFLGPLGMAGMIAGAASIIIMAMALKDIVEALSYLQLMWSIDALSIASAIESMKYILWNLVGCAAVMALLPTSVVGALSAIELAKALQMIMEPLAYLQLMWSIDALGIASAIESMKYILWNLSGCTALLGLFPLSAIGAQGAIGLVEALDKIVTPLQKLGENEEVANRGVKAVKDILLTLTGNAILSSLNPLGELVGGLAHIELATAIDKIADPMIKLGKMSDAQIKQGGKALRKIFQELTNALSLNQTRLLIRAISGLVSSAAIKKFGDTIATITDPLIKLGKMPERDLLKGLVAVDQVLVSLSDTLTKITPEKFGEMIGSLFSGSRANAISSLADGISKLVPAIKELAAIGDIEQTCAIITTLGDTLKKFGDSISGSALWTPIGGFVSGPNSISAGGIKSLIENIETLSVVLPEFISAISGKEEQAQTALDMIGKAFMDFGETLKGTIFWGARTGAEGIGILIDNLDDLASGISNFIELMDGDGDGLATVTTNTGSKLTEIGGGFGQLSGAIGGFAQTIGGSENDLFKFTDFLNNDMSEQKATTVHTSATKLSEAMETVKGGFLSLREAIEDPVWIGVTSRATALSTIIDAIEPFNTGMRGFIKSFGEMSKDDFVGQAEKLSEALKKIGSAVNTFKDAEKNTAKANSFAIVMDALARDLPAVSDFINTLTTSVEDLTTKLETAKTKLDEFAKAINEIKIDDEGFKNKAKAIGEAFITKIGEGINAKKPELVGPSGKIATLMNECVAKVNSYYDKMHTAGFYIMAGLWQGLDECSVYVYEKMAEICQSMQTVIELKNQIDSPSKVFYEYGKYIDLGLVAGLEQYASNVTTASEAVADGAINAAKDRIDQFGFDDRLSTTMTITPVLDMTNFDSQSAGLYRTLDDMQLGTSLSLAAANADGMRRRSAVQNDKEGIDKLTGMIKNLIDNPPSVNHNQFNITNGDPDEVAEKVSQKLQRDIVRRNAVWS